ncbi:MAG TPA: molybdopterin cofactor-binding domain-containing protein, partial [Acidimicrobiia bacterium]
MVSVGDHETWLPDQSRYLGKPQRRLEDVRFVTGTATFVSDLAGPGISQAVFVRSLIPHGELRDVDIGEAARQPGVVAVFTAGDLDLPDISRGLRRSGRSMSRPPLARTRVRYVGEPVAVVIAETREAATDAAEHVWAEIEPLPVVTDPMHAKDGEALFPEGNVVSRVEVTSDYTLTGDDLPVRVQVELNNQRLAPSPIEGLAILCEPSGTRLEITCSHQAPHRLRSQISSMLGVEDVRVVVPDVGGAFGLKGMFFPEYLVVAAAAIRLQKAVMWIERRREHFLSGTHGRGQMHRVELAGDESGRIRRARIEILAEVGAYPHNGAQIPDFTRLVSTGLYDIEHVSVVSTVVVTNRAPTGSYRGAGRPEAAFAIERAVDAFARAAGLDPAVVRAQNFIRPESLPYRTVTGALYDSGDYEAALARALEMVDVNEVRRLQLQRLREGHDPIGLGIGAFIE